MARVATVQSRRAFLGGLAGLGVSTAGLALVNGCGLLPITAQPRVARLGYMWTGSQLTANLTAGFRDGLRDAGWVEGQNLILDERTYGGHPERIPDLASELVASKPDVLLASSDTVAQALARTTDSIPIVAGGLTDPVRTGVIASYARPGGNVTGTTRTPADGSLGPKLLDLLRQLIPGLARVAIVFEEWSPAGVTDWHATQAAAQSARIAVHAAGIAETNDIDLEHALETALAGHPEALITAVAGGSIIPGTNQSALSAVTSFALQHALPTAASRIDITAVGGLLYYGAELGALYRRAASYHVDRILRGAKPADLPVEGPTAFDLILNRTTARALGIAIPSELAAQVTGWVE